jgi:hypothetical protein
MPWREISLFAEGCEAIPRTSYLAVIAAKYAVAHQGSELLIN